MKILLFILTATYLSANGMNEEDLKSITYQALMFLALFFSLYIVSYILSKRNAKKFENENPLEVRREKLELRKKHKMAMEIRAAELLKLFNDKVINDKELKVLQNNLDYIVNI